MSRTTAPAPPLALPRLLVRFLAGEFLDRDDDIRTALAEPLEIQVLDELGQRQLSWLLPVVVDLPELRRVHAELTRHLHVRIGEVVLRVSIQT